MKRPTLTHGWEVEVCVELPCVEGTTDADIDAAKYRRRDFTTRDAALRFARASLPQDAFGSVRVTEFRMAEYEPGLPAWHREYVADSEFVDE